jgi:uncharacterized protein YnzC (UPF0291/DUF896 family)
LSEMPVDALGDALARIVREVAEEVSVPIEMPAMFALGTLSIAALGRATVQMKHAWNEHLGIWTAVIAESGERKSPVARIISKPLREHQRRTIEAEAEDLAVERRIWAANKKRATHLEQEVAKARTEADRQAAVENLRAFAANTADQTEPVEYRLLMDDVTPEKLAQMLGQHPALGFISDEAGPIESLAHVPSDRLSRLDVYLKGYDGDPLSVDRVSRDTDQLDEPLIAFSVCVQPVVATDALSNDRLERRGLLGRFIWCRPKSMVGWREEPDGIALSDDAVAAWDAVVGGLLALPMPSEKASRPVLRFDDQGAELLSAYGAVIEREMRLGERLSGIRSWAGKELGRCGRIAALLHLADGNGTASDVSAVYVERAILLSRWATEEALTAFTGAQAVTQSTPGEEKVLRWLLRWYTKNVNGKGQPMLTKRDLWQGVKGGAIRDMAELDYIVGELREDGFIETEEMPQPGGGRKMVVITITDKLQFWSPS